MIERLSERAPSGKFYGVVVSCGKGCEHLVSAEKNYFDAWSKAYPYGGLDSARTVLVPSRSRTVRNLRRRR